jgi:hypothetical protein
MAGMLRVRRSRGALSGFFLILLGIWGALIPFVGPYFHFAFSSDHGWSLSSGRLWLEVLPGAGAVAAGLIVMASRLRPVAVLGAWLAALSGAWFAAGPVLIGLWSHGVAVGAPAGGKVVSAAEQLSFFAGLGIVIVFVAALALGRLTVVTARDVALAERAADQAAAEQTAATAPAADVPVPARVPAGDLRPGRDQAAAAPDGASPARKPMRARLTKVVPGRSADQAAPEQTRRDRKAAARAAADSETADGSAGDQAAADREAAESLTT